MEYFPAELLVNIFEKLNVADASRCRLMNRRFNEILEKNWKKVQKEKVELIVHTMNNEYLVWISDEIKLQWTRKRLEVRKANDKNNIAILLAKTLGAAPPITNTICISDKNIAIAGIIRRVQQNYCIATLNLFFYNHNVCEDLVSVLPVNSVEHLICHYPKNSEEVLQVMKKLGKERIRSISIHNVYRHKFDLTLMDSLVPQIPFKNIYAPNYVTSVSTVMSVVQSWIDSKWSNMWCLLRTTEEISIAIKKISITDYGVISHFTRKADSRKLYGTLQHSYQRRGHMLVRLFDDLKYENEFLQMSKFALY